MTDFSDFSTQIMEYANRQDWSSTIVTGFIRQAEAKINSELRVDRMIRFASNTVTCQCGDLPDDWLEMDLLRITGACTPTGTWPLKYKARDEFFRWPDIPYSNATAPATSNSTSGYYTIEGREIFFGGPSDSVNGVEFLMSYFAEVPVFSDTQDSWVYTKYPDLYLYASLMHADLHAVGEEDKAASMKQLAEDIIGKLNANYQRSKASGSRLNRSRVRSFG